LRLVCACLLEPRVLVLLGLLKSMFSAENFSYAGCLGLSPAVSAQFTLKMGVAAQNREQIYQKALFWGFSVVQGHQC